MRRAEPREAGFTLIEALVALLILAVASAGLIGAVEAHVDTIRGLELRTAAQWVAENRLEELRLGPNVTSAPDASVAMLGYDWRVRVTQKTSQDPDIRDMSVAVAPAGGGAPLVTLRGFVDAGTTTP